ncbi:signal peptidase II [Lachnospiraceae bacterium NSJ-143]|nr:signal peptidase II [Lachnospiraceae bacterium NSJ-143]
MIIFLLSALGLTIIDQLSKIAALKYLKPVGSIEFIKGLMNLTFVENRGAAFGMLEGARWFFVIITVAVTIAAVIYIKKYIPSGREYRYVKLSVILILAGAWGNAIDRLFRGYVVDYFESVFIKWPVFNVADIYVVAGTVLLAFMFIFVINDEPKK